jgi:hypothetical protein
MPQPNVITLSVDLANDGNPVNKVYTSYDSYQNRSSYIGADHVTSLRDTIAFYRTFAKASGNFRGVKKCAIKHTLDVSVFGVDGSNILAPLIAEVKFSIPEGTPPAVILAMRQRTLALLDLDAVMDPLCNQLLI